MPTPNAYYNVCAENERLKAEKNQLLERLKEVVETWRSQSGRVFESMGMENPRAIMIDNAVERASTAIAAVEKGQP